LQGSNLETQERHNNAMLTRRICKAPKKYSGKSQNRKQETIENIVKNTITNNDEFIKRETMITEELSNLVPVIADLMSFVSNKVNCNDAKLFLLKRDYSVILIIRIYHKHCKFTCSKMNQRRDQLIVKL